MLNYMVVLEHPFNGFCLADFLLEIGDFLCHRPFWSRTNADSSDLEKRDILEEITWNIMESPLMWLLIDDFCEGLWIWS